MSKSKGEQWAQAEAWHRLWPVLQELGVDEKCPDMSGCQAAIEFVRWLAAERDQLRQALEGLLKHAASKAFWEQQSVDHWDKPGPHNAAVKALRAIAAAEAALAPATPGEGGNG